MKKYIAGIIAAFVALTGIIGGLIAWVIRLRKKYKMARDDFFELSGLVNKYIELTEKKDKLMKEEIDIFSEYLGLNKDEDDSSDELDEIEAMLEICKGCDECTAYDYCEKIGYGKKEV
jgi:hypothetical protein